jgi:hypothetical protein
MAGQRRFAALRVSQSAKKPGLTETLAVMVMGEIPPGGFCRRFAFGAGIMEAALGFSLLRPDGSISTQVLQGPAGPGLIRAEASHR